MDTSKIEDFMLLISITDQLTVQSFLEDLYKSKNQVQKTDDKISSDECSLVLHHFKLDNKYYNADIKFVTLEDQKYLKSDLIDQTQALAILFDIKQENCLEQIEEVYSKFNDDILQEKVLICRSTGDQEIDNEILKWCSEKRFEIIDLNEVNTDDTNIQMLDNIDLNRFVEILDTHSWSTIRFKDEQDNPINSTSDLRSEIKQDNLVDSYFKELSLNENGKGAADFDEKMLTFEELFSQIGEFKEKADQLTGEDKHNYAEKVALAFLNSLDEDDD